MKRQIHSQCGKKRGNRRFSYRSGEAKLKQVNRTRSTTGGDADTHCGNCDQPKKSNRGRQPQWRAGRKAKREIKSRSTKGGSKPNN